MKPFGKCLPVRIPIILLLLAAVPCRGSIVAEDGPLPDAPVAGARAAGAPDAHAPKEASAQAEDYGFNKVTLGHMLRNVVHDQGAIWTSPLRIHAHDLPWLLTLSGATAAAVATDQRTLRDIVSHDPSLNSDSTNVSNVAIGGMIAVPVAIYGVGYFRHNDHARETGVLGSEALIDGVGVEQGMKLIFWRERPNMDQGRGKFFQTSAGIDSSFPSSHAVLAWSAAAVIASEYPRPLVQVGIYSAATAVSLARLMGQQHFPGDLLAGSAAGWLVGRYVYKHHHQFGPDPGRHRVEHALLAVAQAIH
jgi:hypothetical protein